MYTYNEIVNDTTLEGTFSRRPYWLASVVLVVFTLIVLFGMVVSPLTLGKGDTQNPYSYSTYHTQYHIPVPPCTMSVTVDTGIAYCAETGKLPTRSQENVWQGYVLWHACYAAHDQLSCDQLNQ